MRINFLKKGGAILTVFTLAAGLFYPATPAQAQFGGPTVIVGDTSYTGTQTMIESTISSVEASLQTGLQSALNIKELTADGIAYGLARTAIQQMVQQTVAWINSGFNGEPAFITDLSGFLGDVAGQVVADTIDGSDLAFLCSPFELDIKIALATQYTSASQGQQPQCTLDEVTDNIEGFINGSFNEGGWPAWFELTQGSSNDPNKALFEAELMIDAAIRDAQGNALVELDWGDGFQSYKYCPNTDVQSGAEADCTIVTPGQSIANSLNTAVGAGVDQLITADEVNEIIGALIGQLSQTILTGTYGLLGLGGSSTYTDTTYGSDGTSSYLEATAQEDVALILDTTATDQLYAGAIDLETQNIALQQQIYTVTNAAIVDHESALPAYFPIGCDVNKNAAREAAYDALAPAVAALTDWRDQASSSIKNSNLVIEEIADFEVRFAAATSSSQQQVILNEYLTLQSSIPFTDASSLARSEIDLEFNISTTIEELEANTSIMVSACRDDDD